MKKINFPATFAVVTTLILSGCNNDMNTSPVEGNVKFTSNITANSNGSTRVSGDMGNVWDGNEEIGVYMYTSALTDGKSNAHYRVRNSSGDLEPADNGDVLSYPGGETDASFVAYYPYKANLHTTAGNVYPINVFDQNENIDLMYAPVKTQSTGTVNLRFSHRLSRLVLLVTDVTGADLAGMTTVIEGMPTTADFDLTAANPAVANQANVAPIAAKLIRTENNTARVEAIVLPGENLDYSVRFALLGGSTATLPMEGKTFLPGRQYKYNVTLNGPAELVYVASENIEGWGAGNDDGENVTAGKTPGETELHEMLCDFETSDLQFTAYNMGASSPMQYNVVDNPVADADNGSARVGKVVTGNAAWEFIRGKNLEKPFVFSKYGTKFTMKVYAPKAGASIYFKMESSTGAPAKELTTVQSGEAGKWVTLEFDVAPLNLPDYAYDRVMMLFDAGVNNAPGQTWYFDDIVGPKGETPPADLPPVTTDYCNFEDVSLPFYVYNAGGTMQYTVADNPDKSGINTSDKVGYVTSGGKQWELLYSEVMTEPMIFRRSAVFTIKVLSPKANGKVYFKLTGTGVPEKEITNVTVTNANEWTLLTYDFSNSNLVDAQYDKITLLFDAGQTGIDENWYFDDIMGPNKNYFD